MARREKIYLPVVGSNNMITIINVTVDDYTDGDDYDILINH